MKKDWRVRHTENTGVCIDVNLRVIDVNTDKYVVKLEGSKIKVYEICHCSECEKRRKH